MTPRKTNFKPYIKDFSKVLQAAKQMLWYLFNSSPRYTMGYVVVLVSSSILPFFGAFLNGELIDDLILRVKDTSTDYKSLIYIGVLLIVTYTVKSLANQLTEFFATNLWFDIGKKFNLDVTTKFANLDLEYYENPEIRDKLNKVNEAYGFRPQQFTEHFFEFLGSAIESISSIAILFILSPLLILIIIISTLPEIIVNIFFGRRSYGIWDSSGDVKRDFFHTRDYLTTDTSLLEIRIFRIKDYLLDRMMNLFTIFQNEQKKIENKRAAIFGLASLINSLGFIFVLGLIIYFITAHTITIGQFSFYLTAATALQAGISNIFKTLSGMYENGLFVYDVFEFLDMKQKIVSGSVCLTSSSVPPSIEIKNLTFKYPSNDIPVFEDLNLNIQPGEHIAIVGENGAGKSTLIKLLMRFYDTNEGSILIDGKNIKKIDLGSWYQKVGALFQDFNFYHFDAKTNIGVGDIARLADEESLTEAAKKSGAHNFIRRYDNKYQQVLSNAFKGGIEPSKGQKQRIALARAFFKDAPILILDEPTSAIDPKAEYEIFQKLFEFAKGKTVVIISHRFSTVRNASRIIVLDKGKIIEDGSHEALMQIENGVYKTSFDLQKKGYE